MFTNEQIRTAMEGLVKAKGENHTSFGRYADPMTNQGACFLGALCEFMGRAVPEEGTAAANVLGAGRVSEDMGVAFTIAQALNDAHFEWKYVLMGVDHALALGKEALSRNGGCPCGCTTTNYTVVLDEVKRRRAMDQMKASRTPAVANGGIITKDMIPPIGKITFDLGGITTFASAMQEFTISMNSVSGTLSKFAVPTYVPAQKDHALVA